MKLKELIITNIILLAIVGFFVFLTFGEFSNDSHQIEGEGHEISGKEKVYSYPGARNCTNEEKIIYLMTRMIFILRNCKSIKMHAILSLQKIL